MTLLDKFEGCRLLVVGDVILDRYWWGDSTRLSPEAPVPIVRMQRATVRAGGAANTAANIVALGADAELIGVIGADQAGAELRGVVEGSRIVSSLVEDPGRPTTCKTRVVAHQQQVVRVDEEETAPLTAQVSAEILRRVQAGLHSCQAVLISDYGKGVVTPAIAQRVIGAARERGVRTFVDPKGADYRDYLGCSWLKPNRAELGVLTHRPVRSHAETLEAARMLRKSMPGVSILVTEGGEGMTLLGAEGGEEHVESERRQVFDVTGAGDTVLATVALAVSAGATGREALELATRAAGIVVGVVGTATVTREQLAARITG
jgi:D-beta-D-heptose 7-phosphate kinase/D-beta-D-heptose 1-phosphate adenosyltransferase